MRLISLFTLTVLILTQAMFVALAHDTTPDTDPPSAWEEFSVSDVDLSGFMDRLYVVLSSEEHLGKYPDVAETAQMLKGMGFFDIAGGHTDFAATGDRIHCSDLTLFDHSNPDTLYSQLFSLPDRELRSASYVSEDDYMLYVGLNGLVDKMNIMLQSETMGPDGERVSMLEMLSDAPDQDIAQAMGFMKALQIDELVGQILTGEIALVLYEAPDIGRLVEGNIQPADIDAAIMLGISDSEYISEMISGFGSEIGLSEMEIEDPAWRGYRLDEEEGIGFAFNDEILIASPNFDIAALHVGMAESDGGMDLPPCQMHLDIDMEALHNGVIHPVVQMLAAEAGASVVPQHESMMYLFNVPEPSALGNLTVTESHPDGNKLVELDMKKAVLTYLVFYLAMGADVAAQAGAFN